MLQKLMTQFNRKGLKDEHYAFLFDEHSPEDELVVFDTETTGLNPKTDQIISIGAVKIKGDKILMEEKFDLYLKPEGEVQEESIKIHGIRNVDLTHGLPPRLAIGQFLEFIGSRPLVGYYLEFDIAMINRYIKPWLGIKLPNQQIEVSKIYHDKKRKSIPEGMIDLRFDVIMKDLDLPVFGKHDAINDAVMTALMYITLKHTHTL